MLVEKKSSHDDDAVGDSSSDDNDSDYEEEEVPKLNKKDTTVIAGDSNSQEEDKSVAKKKVVVSSSDSPSTPKKVDSESSEDVPKAVVVMKFNFSRNLKACLKRKERLELRLRNHRTQMQLKEDLKTVALGTSKINYMDPRITVSWCKRQDVPIKKVFNKSLLEKFAWAMDVDEDFDF